MNDDSLNASPHGEPWRALACSSGRRRCAKSHAELHAFWAREIVNVVWIGESRLVERGGRLFVRVGDGGGGGAAGFEDLAGEAVVVNGAGEHEAADAKRDNGEGLFASGGLGE